MTQSQTKGEFNMMVAICDDEPSDAKVLETYVESYSQNIMLNVFGSGNALLEAIHSGQLFDVIFLDIRMDGVNGYELAKYLNSRESQSIIIFVTETRQYIAAGYEFARGYIHKPATEKKVHSLLFKAQKYFEPKKIMINMEDRKILVNVRDILYFHISGRTVTLYTLKKEYQFQSSLKDQMKSLPLEMFFQPHHSYLINLDKLESISLDSKRIILYGGTSIPLSRKRKESFYKSLTRYHFLARDINKQMQKNGDDQ
jgi:DNA-binding LytR/AlgR family response regulator